MGGNRQDDYLKESSMIALDATPEQTSRCSPPGDMRYSRAGAVIGMSGGKIVACGGAKTEEGFRDSCEEFNRDQGKWTTAKDELSKGSAWIPSVQLDENRIWMGRKFKVAHTK